ncbi:MAG: hypothetical protein H6838_04715 [Planctomycetes bacterium]|nr:hypothetical protein [Planctomycetota bacterium]MCB9884769.1 hypothetical protein [Planctomycetota bacterium]
MYSTLLFWSAFGATVLLIVLSLVSGYRRKRRFHLVTGPLTMVALVFAVIETEALMRRYDFPREALDTHLIFAKAGGLMALPVIATGIWLWRNPRVRFWHRLAVWLWLLSVLTATGTGLWIFELATPKAG